MQAQRPKSAGSSIIFGALAAGGVALVSTLLYSFYTKRRKAANAIKPVLIEGHRVLNKKDLITILTEIRERSKFDVGKTTLYFRNARRERIEDLYEYEKQIRKMHHKLEKYISEVCLMVLAEHNLSQKVFEQSIEYHNDEQIQTLIDDFLLLEKKKGLEGISGKQLTKLFDLYEKIQRSILESTDLQAYEPLTLRYQIEDKIWKELGIEINDVDWNAEGREIDTGALRKVQEIGAYLGSIKMLNGSLFK